jgi:hypothetical protein
MIGSSCDLDPEAALARARAFIARTMLESETVPPTLGDLTLHPHQREAVGRVRALLRAAGGALLADSTGLGKTFVGLVVARDYERVLVVAPAALAENWEKAMARARVAARFISLERLSRGARAPVENPDLLIVDEAHHLRNPRTKCYDVVASLCVGACVLLLTATPLQNRRADLVAQLALFLGDAAIAATDAELARFIVRRLAEERALRLPSVSGPRWIELPPADDVLDDLLALPSPIAGADEGTAGALVAYTLVRQWSSSRAALVAALRRRIARAVAMISSLEAGIWPSRQQLAAWSYAEQTVQLAFADLLAPLGTRPSDLSSMLAAVRNHLDGLRVLMARLRHSTDPDPLRAAALIDVCRAHSDARIIAFSQYAETVAALSRLLMPRQPGVAALTASGGRVAGGRISRREVLAQFAPQTGRSTVSAAEQITLLVATDVLSEGLDLQRASVVVHLDLPWNPARLEQRVGRVRRLGSEHETVFVYALAPPSESELLLRVVERLRAKLGIARQIVGLGSAVIPGWATDDSVAPPELASEAHALLESWSDPGSRAEPETTPACAVARAPHDGFIALLADGAEPMLVAAFEGNAPSRDPATVGRALAMCRGPAGTTASMDIETTRTAIRDWWGDRSTRSQLAVSSAAGARLRTRLAARITALLSASPRHERASLAPLASRAHMALRVPLGIGAERRLAALESAPVRGVEWLRAIAALADGRHSRAAAIEPQILLLVLLRRRGQDQTDE